MRISDVLDKGQHELLLVEGYLNNGNWIPVIDNTVIPGCPQTDDEPPEIQLSTLKPDAREGPAARLSYYPDKDYNLTLKVPTQQQSVIAAVLGRGAQILDKTAANTNNKVGKIQAITSVDDAIFGIAKLQGTTGDWEFDITRLPHAGFQLATMYPAVGAVPGTHYDYCLSIYNPTTNTCTVADAVAIGATITPGNYFVGSLNVSSMVLSAGQVFQYDPETSGVITIGSDSVTVDPLLVDPNLRAGDWCVIYGIAYEYSQLSRDGDWQVTQPLTKPTRCTIDLYMSLSDVMDYRQWKRKRYYYCEQTNLPAESTSGDKTDPNTIDYVFVVRPHANRLYNNGKYCDVQFLVDN